MIKKVSKATYFWVDGWISTAYHFFLVANATNLALCMWISSADDGQKFYTFLNFFLKFKFSLLYLDTAWKMHSNEYKQA